MNAGADPPEMLLSFDGVDGGPRRRVWVRLRSMIPPGTDVLAAASIEVARFTPEQVELLADVARPDPAGPKPAFGATVTVVQTTPRYRGAIHCPACGGRVTFGTSPAAGYVRRCQHCGREIELRFEGPDVYLILRGDA